MGFEHTSQQDFGGPRLSGHKVTTPFMSPWIQTYISNQLSFQAIYALRKRD